MPKDILRAFALDESVFTIPEAASYIRVSRSYFYELIADGKIKITKIGKRSVVRGCELRRFMAAAAAA